MRRAVRHLSRRQETRYLQAMDLLRQKKGASQRGFLDDQFLIAMPGMKDDRFSRAVIYICAHSDEGAMGLIINQVQPLLFPDLLVQLGILDEQEAIRLPGKAQGLHRPQWRAGRPQPRLRAAQRRLQGRILVACLRRDLPDGDRRHPARHFRRTRAAPCADGARLFRLGRRPARKRNRREWLADLPGRRPELLFDTDIDRKYDRILATLGIDLARLSSGAGHA
jgi:putative transcriptional regulator